MALIVFRHLIVSLGIFVCLTGCGTAQIRRPLPAGLAGRAGLSGYHGIRDWGDQFSPVLQRSAETALETEAGNSLGRTPIQYLSLSGGGMNGAFGAGFFAAGAPSARARCLTVSRASVPERCWHRLPSSVPITTWPCVKSTPT